MAENVRRQSAAADNTGPSAMNRDFGLKSDRLSVTGAGQLSPGLHGPLHPSGEKLERCQSASMQPCPE
jgi:hypothetical protein